jgi:hypothetical protein
MALHLVHHPHCPFYPMHTPHSLPAVIAEPAVIEVLRL